VRRALKACDEKEKIMKTRRRRFLQLAGAAAALPALPRIGYARAYPSRPVRLIVTVPAGGSPDIIGRLIAQWLSEKLGQPFVVEDKPGASTNIGTELVLKSAPDGGTLLLAMSSNAINPALYHHLNFNFLRDAAPVASIATIPLVMDVNPAVAAKTVPEFIAYAKANPGKINLASGGSGTPLYVAGALFRMMADVKLVDVIYQGEGGAMPDLLSGQVQAMFGVMPASLGYIKSGKLRALAVTSTKRTQLLPGVPAMAEFLPGYEANGWYGIVAPKGTSADVIETLNKQVNAALADPAMRKRFTDLGCEVFTGSPADFGKFIQSETAKWAKVIKFAGIKAD
jgi:tripartite-type tricarboxylate transporter receptor subunit TctC